MWCSTDRSFASDSVTMIPGVMAAISAGGPTAITYAARNPEKVTRIAFYASLARTPKGVEEQLISVFSRERKLDQGRLVSTVLPSRSRGGNDSKTIL